MGIDIITKKILLNAKIKNQRVILLFDNKHKSIADSFVKEIKELTTYFDFFNIDKFNRPLKEIPKEILSSTTNSDIIFMIISKVEKDHYEEYPFLKKSFFDLKKQNPKLRLGFLLDVTKEQFKEIFNYNPSDIKELNKILYKHISLGKKVVVKTTSGTNIEFDISSKELKWINQDAELSKPSMQHSILAGEVYGCPTAVNGFVVIDGVMGSKFSKFGELKSNPLKIQIENSKIISAFSKNKELMDKFLKHINSIENAKKVGELGFGTNTALEKFYGVIGIDEKFPGIHIAFGHPYSEKTGANWSSKTHVDCVLKNCDVWIDDKKIMNNSKYIF